MYVPIEECNLIDVLWSWESALNESSKAYQQRASQSLFCPGRSNIINFIDPSSYLSLSTFSRMLVYLLMYMLDYRLLLATGFYFRALDVKYRARERAAETIGRDDSDDDKDRCESLN